MIDDQQHMRLWQQLDEHHEVARSLWERSVLARSAALRACGRSATARAASADRRLAGTRPPASLPEATPLQLSPWSRDGANGAVGGDPQLLQLAASVPEQARLLDLAFDAVMARSFSQGTITFWNQGAEQLFGWTRAEALGKRATDLLRTEFPEPLEEIERQVSNTGRWEGQLVHRAKEGRKVVVDSRWAARSHPRDPADLILQIESDVTVRVEAQRRLDEMDQLLRLLVSNVQDYALFVLDPQGRVMSWNDGAWRLKQYTRAEILGQHFSIFYEPEQAADGRPGRALAIALREGRYQDEGWRVRKDGTRFWADVVITALLDDGGELRGFAKITRDLTEKHRESERLTELEAVKSQFLRLASHELRGPLGTLRGYTSLLKEGALEGRAAEKARAYEVIDDKAQHITWLVNQMLETSRLEEGRLELMREPVDLRSMIGHAVEETRVLNPSSHDLVLDTPEEPVLVQADKLRIVTVVHNLLDNAVKYSPAGGAVRCRVSVQQDTGVIEVTDHGLGISHEDLPMLFTRFGRIVTAENSHISGAGLGLYFCREVARMHGGELSVSSEPGNGSTFRLQLPLIEG